jgi:hypothetical protein
MFKLVILFFVCLNSLDIALAEEKKKEAKILIEFCFYKNARAGNIHPYTIGSKLKFRNMINFELMIDEILTEYDYPWILVYFSDKTPLEMLTKIIPLLKKHGHKVKIIKVDNIEKKTKKQWGISRINGVAYMRKMEAFKAGENWVRASDIPPFIPIGQTVFQWGTDNDFDFISDRTKPALGK